MRTPRFRCERSGCHLRSRCPHARSPVGRGNVVVHRRIFRGEVRALRGCVVCSQDRSGRGGRRKARGCSRGPPRLECPHERPQAFSGWWWGFPPRIQTSSDRDLGFDIVRPICICQSLVKRSVIVAEVAPWRHLVAWRSKVVRHQPQLSSASLASRSSGASPCAGTCAQVPPRPRRRVPMWA